MTNEEIIEMAHKSGLHLATDVNWMPIIGLEYLEKFAKLVAEKERASNHAYIYELERDLEVAQDKINDCLVCLNFNPLEAAQDKIKGCLGILNYNPRGKK